LGSAHGTPCAFEAGLSLYGYELGLDPDGREIPILSCPIAKPAVSFSPLKGDFVGKSALLKQFEALKKIINHDHADPADLHRMIRPIALIERGVARPGVKNLQRGTDPQASSPAAP